MCKNFWPGWIQWIHLIYLVILIIFVCLIIFVYLGIPFLPVRNIEISKLHLLPHELSVIYYLAVILLTLALAIIAASQLGSLSKTATSDYLLRLDERFHGTNSINARKIIHELYLKCDPDNTEPNNLWHAIGVIICKMRKEPTSVDKFISLKDYLELFETIGYLYSNKKITIEEISGLFGYSVIKFYKIFEPYMSDRKFRRRDKRLYCEFEKLYEAVKLYNEQ